MSQKKHWATWMKAAKDGDQITYQALMAEILPVITHYVRKRVANKHDVEDLVQDILLRVHIYRQSYKNESAIEPWLFTISRNTLADYYRTRHQQSQLFQPEAEVAAESSVYPSAEAELTYKGVVNSLTESQQQVLYLSKFTKKSSLAVAQYCNCSLSAAKVRAHRICNMVKLAMCA